MFGLFGYIFELDLNPAEVLAILGLFTMIKLGIQELEEDE